jgi:hydroxymethylbilane synthase
MDQRPLVIGSRGSELALWQTRWVAARLPVPTTVTVVSTAGDRILDRDLSGAEGKGFFTRELEEELFCGRIDLAVHSLKDLPTLTPTGLAVAAVCERAPVADVLLVHPDWHAPGRALPVKPGGSVGASSLRRQAFVRAADSSLEPASLRGNVPTRVRKCREGRYAAVVLAEAGLSRLQLDLSGLYAYRLLPARWLPAPGQGALGLQTRASGPALEACRTLDHADTRLACDVERGVLAAFEGGCHLPLGTWARATLNGVHLRACFAPAADRLVSCEVTGTGVQDTIAAAFEALKTGEAAGRYTSLEGVPLCEPLDAWS